MGQQPYQPTTQPQFFCKDQTPAPMTSSEASLIDSVNFIPISQLSQIMKS